jgi:hypothetical protein
MYILVRKLIRSNADVNIRTELGESPLICAAAHNPHCIRTLLESKANPLLQTKYGDTAISEARRHGHTTEAKLIEEAEQNPEHLEAKFNQNAYIVLMISGQGLTCKNNVQCQQVPLNAKPPKGQPYLRVFHDNKLLMKPSPSRPSTGRSYGRCCTTKNGCSRRSQASSQSFGVGS